MTPEHAVLLAIAICVGAAAVTLLTSRASAVTGWIAFAATAVSAVLVGSAIVDVWMNGPREPVALWGPDQFRLAAPRFYVDGLASVFLGLAALVAVPAMLYSIGYVKRRYSERGCGAYYALLLLFLAAMFGLVSTTDMMWFFLVFWQLMTLPGYALIRFEGRPDCIRAANKYLIMMQIACFATMLGAELLVATVGSASAGAGPTYDFDTVSANLPLLLAMRHGPVTVAVAFTLFLVGFGIKMGMWPFGQVWLPDAHPAAPSPVSALLSGVMIKTGVYGLVRYFLWLVPVKARSDFPLAWWGAVVALLGTVTLFTGTMQALRQEESKRLLAFSSIGQIGYVLLGIGTCMALLDAGTPAATAIAALGLLGALFHVVNHGMFKSLLFLDAGSMLCATDTLNLNKMGGLAKFMPMTALTALVASFAISGVPLFNGFVSKWALCAAAIRGGGVAWYLPLCGVIALLTSALTLALFVKFYGATFLSRATDAVKVRAAKLGKLEVGWTMRLPQLFLAAMCLLLGLVPAWPLGLLQRALEKSHQGLGGLLAEATPVTGNVWTGVEAFQGGVLFAPLAVLALLGATFLVAHTLSRVGGGARRTAEPWLCGYAHEADCFRYSAHSLYGEIKRRFRWLGGAPRPGKQAE